MRESRTKTKQGRKGFGCFTVIILSVILTALTLGGIYLWINFQLQASSDTINESSLNAITQDGNESIDFTLNRQVVNRLFSEMIASMPENLMALSLVWEDDQLIADVQLEQAGMQVPASATADVYVTEDHYFRIDFESVNIGGVPLPTQSAYELLASQVTLPTGATFSSTEPQIIININQFEGIDPAYTVLAKSVDLANNELVVEVQYNATTNPLIQIN